jgi:hypothetical protein
MPLPTFNNGESNASVRTKINNCITQVNDLVANPLPVVLPIDFENGSFIDAGDPAYGSNSGGGIEQVCAADYRQRWEGGRLWFYDQNATGVREVRMNFGAPTINDDSKTSLRFRVGSRWIHEDGRTWVCRDATEGNAVWDLVSSQPSVIYVTKAGNDTTGDGTMTNPFLTPAVAFAHATSLAVNVIVDFGVGSFTYTSSSAWPNFVAGIRGQGPLTNLAVNFVCSECSIQADSMNFEVIATGAAGANGTNGSPASNGDNGSDSPNITVIGTANVGSVYSVAGNGGNGGGAIVGGETGGRGGNGGNAAGTITIRCPVITGTIIFVAGSGGAGGNAGPGGGSEGAAGDTGGNLNPTIITDGAYMVSSNLSSTYWKAGRCSYSTGSPTTDFGGNAIIT